ncbi:MAG: ABC transporter permease subunit [Candidatus Hydrogenedens sp.]|nr:Gldg family protein [Candidatus Hydrogenedentota bacterium]NLF56341.1 ABC transporter permease subunit [Candidatus Hydrogenedens sp.]
MRNIISILRRDLGAYFTSPIGYIFMMVFVTLSVGLYITSFFVFPIADMRSYFENIPLLLCVFIPAVTMRIWAEERKENTWEMLLTFPMKAWELVFGKFFAALIFYIITLSATVTVPAMLFSLGNPDPGTILGGYLGALLMGAFFLSLGILFSGFFKDQIVAFVVTLLACFGFFLVGTGFIASYIDGRVAGLGSLLSDLMGVFTHYTPFIRGVVDVADLAFFLVWIGIFLALNVLYIDGRNRPGAKAIFGTALAMSVAIGLMFNYLLAGSSIARADLTQDKIYTVSEATRDLLAKVDSEVQVKVYITPKDKMPTQMRSLETQITDKLDEMRIAAGGKMAYDVVYLEAANIQYTTPQDEEGEKTEDEAIEKRMLDKGVEPFSVQAISEDEMTNKLVYSSIGVGYRDKPEEILPQVIPDDMGGGGYGSTPLSQLEYRLANTVYKMTRPKATVVALVAPKEAVTMDPQMRAMLMQMGQRVPEQDDPYEYLQAVLEMEKYEVRRVDLTKESPLPEEFDTLVVVNPRELNERQLWEINRALHSGKPVVMAVQNYEWNYQATRQGNQLSRREENPGVNPLLEQYGLGVSTAVLMDSSHTTLTMQGGQGLQALMGQPFKLPTHIMVANDTMESTSPITNRLSAILYLWGTALELNEAKLKELGLESQVLMRTTDGAWDIPANAQMTQGSFEQPPSGTRSFPLMAMVSGQFPDAYAGKERPAWPKPPQQPGMPPMPDEPDTEPAAGPAAAAPGKLVLMGCSQMFRKNFLQRANLDLFLNSVDAVTLDESLIKVRGRKPIDRIISTKPSDRAKTVWRFANYGLANLVIAAAGLLSFAVRRRARNAYTVSQAKGN